MSAPVYIVELDALDATDTPVTLRFASGDYTGPGDVPYRPRLRQPALFERTAQLGPLLPGIRGGGSGEIELINADGGLDDLADFAVDGRTLTLSRVDQSVEAVLQATVEGLSFTGNRVRLALRDPLAVLDVPLASARYAGDNVLPDGVEGTDDIEGTPKPRVLGSVVNARPVLVNSAKLIYQVHEGADCTITALRDRGVTLPLERTATDLTDLLTTPPPAGEWARYQGHIALGATADGEITCDAHNADIGAGDVLAAIAEEAGLDMASGDIAALNAVGDVGLMLTDAETAPRSLVDQIAHGCGAWWTVVEGELRVKPLVAPVEVADRSIEPWQILRIERTAFGSGSNGLPVTRVVINADPVVTVQTDVAAVADTPARWAQATRDAVAVDAAVATRHPLAETLTISSPLRSVSGAQGVVATLLDLLAPRRDIVELDVALNPAAAALELGMTLAVSHPRLGPEPKHLVLLGIGPDARRGRYTLRCWG